MICLVEYTVVTLDKEGAVGVLTLNNPATLNALNSTLVAEMGRALEVIAADNQIRALIVTGGEKVFAAGGDIKAMMECTPLAAKEYVASIHTVFNHLAQMHIPTIAAICGYALGGGLELAACCDFRFAGEGARFGFPEVTLGIFPAAGGSQRIPRLIGVGKAKELMFSGDIIDAKTALGLGLVNRVVPDSEVITKAKEFAQKLSTRAPLALRYLKASIHAGLNTDLNTGLEQELEKVAILFSTRDQKEGMRAFMEKRKPNFIGE